jgi:LysR family hydrogen peroxide-inducible transcriptional activator
MGGLGDLDSLSVRDLRAVVTLAERLHFGKAAEDLSITQPSLSAAVKKVEEVLGERLFERTSRHVSLTPAGQRAVQRIRSVLEEIAEISRPAAQKDLLSGRFRLGLVPTIGPYYAPGFLAPLRERYPRLELVLTEALTETLLQMLRQRVVDAAIICLPTGEPGLTETPLLRERFLLAVPSHHPLSAAAEVNPGDLDPRELLLTSDGARPLPARADPGILRRGAGLRHQSVPGGQHRDLAASRRRRQRLRPDPRNGGRPGRVEDAAELAGFLTKLHRGSAGRVSS